MADLDHDITIESDGGRVVYELETTGRLEGGDPHGDLEEKFVAGHCWNGTDSFSYNGAIIDLIIHRGEEFVTVTHDGETIPHELLSMSRLDIHAPGGRGYYKFATSGKTIRTADEPVDTVFDGGEQVRGTAGKGGHEAYRFQGVLQGFKCTEDMDVWVDGQPKGVIEGAPFGEAPDRWD